MFNVCATVFARFASYIFIVVFVIVMLLNGNVPVIGYILWLFLLSFPCHLVTCLVGQTLFVSLIGDVYVSYFLIFCYEFMVCVRTIYLELCATHVLTSVCDLETMKGLEVTAALTDLSDLLVCCQIIMIRGQMAI